MGRVLSSMMLLVLPAMATAQTVLGIKGGLNVADIVMTNYINPDVESDLRIKLGLHAGFFVNGTVNERLGMGGELMYSSKGVRGGGSNINLHYVALPFLVQYALGEKLFAEIGPELGYLFSAQSEHGNVSSTYSNKFDLSLDAGIQLNAPRITFGLRYCVGLFSVREPMETTGPAGIEKIKYQNRVLQLSVGYKVWSVQ